MNPCRDVNSAMVLARTFRFRRYPNLGDKNSGSVYGAWLPLPPETTNNPIKTKALTNSHRPMTFEGFKTLSDKIPARTEPPSGLLQFVVGYQKTTRSKTYGPRRKGRKTDGKSCKNRSFRGAERWGRDGFLGEINDRLRRKSVVERLAINQVRNAATGNGKRNCVRLGIRLSGLGVCHVRWYF